MDIIHECLKFLNGLGDTSSHEKSGCTEIKYIRSQPSAMVDGPPSVKFNVDHANRRLHPVDYGMPNQPRDGVKFNS